MKVVFLFVACLVGLVCSQTSSNTAEQQNDAQGAALDKVRGLYVTLRNIAFPHNPLTNDKHLENRFLLLMPGKVLNYFDYYPGKEYTTFIQNPDATTKEAVVPPHTMEKWFDLVDTIPSPNPMNGQDTGKSLSTVYSSILHEIKVKGLESKTQSERAIYNQSVTYLNELVQDPVDPTQKVARLTLFERYRDLYNDRKLDMEDVIENKRQTSRALDYELWFQRHYPSLQAKVESAYTQWLIFGEKENVELEITNMDTGSSAKMLEDARMALRAAGVSSLDRTRTVYPVSFEPSDWYKYLLPELQTPSRDQLLSMAGKVRAKIGAIEAMMNSSRSNPDDISDLKKKYADEQHSVNVQINTYLTQELQCLKDSSGVGQHCKNYDDSRSDIIANLSAEAGTFATYQHVNYYYQYHDSYLKSLQDQKNRLETQLQSIESLLGEATPFLGGLLDATSLEVASLQDTYRDREWEQFEFDSHQYYEQRDSQSTSESVTKQMGFHFLFFSAGGSSTYNKETTDNSDHIAKSKMRVKGEMLRVTIKRPWFKPELFENPEVDYRESDGTGYASYVSPGRELSEVQFYESLIGDKIQYKLPEYPTSFLLGRNIEMEFSGLDSSVVTSTMNEMSHSSGGGGFLFFHASASVTKSKSTSSVNIQRTADGMKIKIPGAQIMGYYTQVVPRFPAQQNS